MATVRPLLLCLVVACGGSSSNQSTGGPTTDGPDKDALCEAAMTATMDAHEESWNAILAKGAPTTLEEMAAAACERFCGRSSECAIEDACAKLEAAKLAELDLEKTGPESTRQCVAECSTWSLTKEQVQTLGSCAQADDASCDEFRSCTGALQQSR